MQHISCLLPTQQLKRYSSGTPTTIISCTKVDCYDLKVNGSDEQTNLLLDQLFLKYCSVFLNKAESGAQ